MNLILTGPGDPHADAVVARLERRGARVLCFDYSDFPQDAELSVELGRDGSTRVRMIASGLEHDLTEVTAAWVRRPGRPSPRALAEPTRDLVITHCFSFLEDLWTLLPCRWLPGPYANLITLDRHKLAHLALAAKLGFEIPSTCAGNSPDGFLDLHARAGGRVVSKLHSGAADMMKFGGRYTEPVTARDLAHVEAIREGPVIFQEAVPKQIELRVTVVGERTFCAAVHSQVTLQTQTDWRKYDDATPHTVHELPAAVASRCVELTRRIGVAYGAIDLILTPDGRYVFLEINPNGQYLWIEAHTGLPISDAICDWLLGNDPRPI